MSLKIRLARAGAKKRPYYRIVIADSRSPRDGRYIEKVGTYDPLLPRDGERVKLVEDRIKHWLSVGAQPTDRVLRFLDKAGMREARRALEPEQGPARQEAARARGGEGRRRGREGQGRRRSRRRAAAERQSLPRGRAAYRRIALPAKPDRVLRGGDRTPPRPQGRGAPPFVHRRASRHRRVRAARGRDWRAPVRDRDRCGSRRRRSSPASRA